MELDGETLQVRIIHAFAAPVVGVLEGFLPDALQGIRHDRVAVVLGGDIGAAGVQVPDGLVAATVAVFQLDCVAAQGQGRQLVAQADAEDRLLPDELFQFRDAGGVFLWISGTVGKHNAVCARG